MLPWGWLVAVVPLLLVVVEANDSDRFNYRGTDTSGGYNDYGPLDWSQVTCSNVDECLGWPDKWQVATFPFVGNNCLWCPDTGNSCGLHRQSPIDLDRHVGVPGDPLERACNDDHWMKYDDSTCTWQDLVKNNAFTVERHALKLTQPLIGSKDNKDVELNCKNELGQRKFGRMSMSHDGFNYWHFSHVDFHVPSEHTQHGKRYSAEAHMYHFLPTKLETSAGTPIYSTTAGQQAMATTILFQAYDDAEPYGFLEKLICQWRRAEDATRAECGLPSIATNYPGCFSNHRGSDNNTLSSARRNVVATNSGTRRLDNKRKLRSHGGGVDSGTDETTDKASRPKMSALDVMLKQNGDGANRKLRMDPSNFEPTDIDWDAFIQSQYEQEKAQQGHRRLANYEHVGPWHNYFLMIGVKTEYYFRYQGSLTFPPCYGPYIPNSKLNSTHFRVMKDPIRVHPRQIAEMERLLAHRIAPLDDPNVSCQPDTAGAFVDGSTDRVNVARPLQSVSDAHYASFCDCQLWGSHWKEDKAWCDMDLQTRFFDQPYNFRTKGF